MLLNLLENASVRILALSMKAILLSAVIPVLGTAILLLVSETLSFTRMVWMVDFA